METIEGNKFIAEFMGAIEQTEQIKPARAPLGKMYFQGTNNRFPDLMFTCYAQDLRYNSSWDWLMPVWRKLYLKISDMPPTLYYDDRLKEQVNALRYWYEEMEQPLTKVLIDIAWKTLVKAILWYDTTKPQPNAK